MYGTQAIAFSLVEYFPFENDVNMYGTQAVKEYKITHKLFENDVNMYGTQAKIYLRNRNTCLRMM